MFVAAVSTTQHINVMDNILITSVFPSIWLACLRLTENLRVQMGTIIQYFGILDDVIHYSLKKISETPENFFLRNSSFY